MFRAGGFAVPFPLRDMGKFFGIFVVCLGAVGWGSGFYFAQPVWLATGHPVIHSLGYLALVLGPVFVISGIISYLFFSYGTIKGYEQHGELMRRFGGRRKVFVSALLVAVAAVGVYGVIAANQQPQFALDDMVVADAHSQGVGCWGTQVVGAAFTVVNSGPASGYIDVRVSGGIYVIGEQTYYVPAGGSVRGSINGSVPCNAMFTTVAAIVAVRGP